MTNNKKINNISLIAHRLGYKMTMFPENSIAAINEIFSQKHLLDSCSGFEFDICFTKDNIPIIKILFAVEDEIKNSNTKIIK